MSSLGDLRASASNPAHADLFRRMVDLEALSSFAFQGNRWLADIAPHLLSERQASAIAAAKRIATARRSEEHTSELQSLMRITFAVFCLKKKNTKRITIAR